MPNYDQDPNDPNIDPFPAGGGWDAARNWLRQQYPRWDRQDNAANTGMGPNGQPQPWLQPGQTPGYSNSPYAASPSAIPHTGGQYGGRGPYDIKGTTALMQYPGIIPDSAFVTNFGLAGRGGSGVDILNKGLGGLYQTQDQQRELAQKILDQAENQGPSAAQAQFQSGLDQSLKSAMAIGQSGAGASPGASMRSILEAQGSMAGQASSQAAQLRAQEEQRQMERRLQGQSLAGQILSGVGGESTGISALGAQLSDADRNALLNLEAQRSNVYSRQPSSNLAQQLAGAGIAAAGAIGGIWTGGATVAPGIAAGSAVAQSDEREKKNIKRFDEEAAPGVPFAEFEYKKDPSHKKRMGVIAQDLEKVAPEYVKKDERGHRWVDYSFLQNAARGVLVGGKAKRKGDAEENDTVPAMLSPGEAVIPRSIMQAEDAPDRAREFVAAIKKAKGGTVPGKGYGAVLAKQREIKQQIAALDRMISAYQ